MELEYVVSKCNSQGFTLKGGRFPRKPGSSMDKNKEICLTGESLANLSVGTFLYHLFNSQTSVFCQKIIGLE